MGQRSRALGWHLLLTSSLCLLGCDALKPRRGEPLPQDSWELVKPAFGGTSANASKLLADKAAGSDKPISRPSLLAPVPERDMPFEVEKPQAPANPAVAALQALFRQAAERYAATPVYSARLVRRELVDGKKRPEEHIQIKYRQEPASLVLRWLESEYKNREVLFVKGRYDDMLQIWPGANDPLAPKGGIRRVIARPDSAQGLGKERYPVRETGIGPLIDRFGLLVAAAERGDKAVGSVKHLGNVKRPEFDAPVDAVLHLLPAGVDGRLPTGGQRLWFFDARLRFPVLVIAHDSQGQEAEYYCFDRFLFPNQIPDDEFDPAKMGRR